MAKTKPKFLSIYPSCLELAMLMKANAAMIEKPLVAKGAEFVAIYVDSNFKDSFKNYHDLKMETLKMVLEDLAAGAPALRSSTVGLSYRNNRVEPYISPHGTMPPSNTMYSINLKESVAFKNYLFSSNEDLPEEMINVAIYYITLQLSKLI